MQSGKAQSSEVLNLALEVSAETAPRRRGYELGKRAFDLTVAALLLVLLSPLFLLIAVRVKRSSPGPVFYRGPRLGKDGRLFYILKFRTMYERPESYNGPRLTASGDPRVTPFGRWLRETKLNELPQLVNVLRGEMSLVGPRPEDPELAASWPLEAQREVLSVRPGITSPASVLYRDEENQLKPDHLMSAYLGTILPSKLRLDQLYVRHRSLLLDLDVLFWTLLVLIPKVGAAKPQEARLFLGPISRLLRRYASWFVIDMVVTLSAMAVTGIFWRSLGPLNVGLYKATAMAVGFALLYSLVGAMIGVYRIAWSKASLADALDLLPAVILSTLIALLANVVWTTQPILPPGLILMAAALSGMGFVGVRYRSRLLQAMADRWLNWRGRVFQAQERVLIVGGGESGQFLAWWLQHGNLKRVLRVVGFVDDDLYKHNLRISGIEVLGGRDDIPALVTNYDVGLILFAIHNISEAERKRLLRICSATQARVMVAPDVLGLLQDMVSENLDSSQAAASIPATQVAAWLDELAKLSRAEDQTELRARIESLKSQLISLKG